MSFNFTFKIDDSIPDGVVHIVTRDTPSSAKDVPCLVDPPNHNWYEIGIYMKCSKCGMSYEKPASKDFQL